MARQTPPGGASPQDFFAAQRRHRRAARAYSALATLVVVAQSVPAAVMISPLMLGALVLAADLADLVRPVPDLVRVAQDRLGHGSVAPADWLLAVLVVVAPGCLLIAATWWVTLRVLLRRGFVAAVRTLPHRRPDPSDPREHQLANVVAEMAAAAGIAVPEVLVLDVPGHNLAVVGGRWRRPDDPITIAVGRDVLDELDRAGMTGMVAIAVSSAVNGDLRMAHTLCAVFASYGIASAVFLAPVDGEARRLLRRLTAVARGTASPAQERAAVEAALSFEGGNGFSASMAFLTWRLNFWITNLFLVGPVLALPWRARRYLADSTAVQLTRQPAIVADALTRLAGLRPAVRGASYAAPCFVLDPSPGGPAGGPAGGPDDGEPDLQQEVGIATAVHPPIDRRLQRLGRLAGRPQARASRRRRPVSVLNVAGAALALAVLVPIGAAMVVVILALVLTCVLLAVTVLAIGVLIVVGPLHALLRGLA